MNKERAREILIRHVSNLQSRRNQLFTEDLEAEVINTACFEILKKRKEKTSDSKSIEALFGAILDSTNDIMPIAKSFTDAAIELFPQNYSHREAANALLGISNNVMWEGMWDFLRDYYNKNHGWSIDDVQTDAIIFYSTRHQRFENGVLTSESEVERTININKVKDSEEIIVSIEPSLSPKKGFLKESSDNKEVYNGYDPDFRFHIFYDDFGEIEKFILERIDRNLKLQYFE